MDKTNSKILTVSFAIAGALLGFILSLLISAFTGVSGTIAQLAGYDAFKHGVPVAAGLILFLFLQFNPRTLTWAEEVVSELRKVVWPTRKDVSAMTVVVCAMVIVSSAIIASFDLLSGYVINILMRS